MDERQARNPNTTYNGYKMNSGSFLDMEADMPSATKITQKEQKETTKE